MKRSLLIAVTLIVLAAAGFLILKITIPFQYAEAELRPDVLQYLEHLQEQNHLSPAEAAQLYKYHGTDYEGTLPPRIQITEAIVEADVVRVSFYDPSARDDSIFQTRSRIYMRRNSEGHWLPFKHEWSHKGRGRFGWTTKPTT